MDAEEKGGARARVDGPVEYVPGFPELSAYMSVDPDLQVYRRFDRICTRNLLYLQSEIMELEAWFEQHDAQELEQLRRTEGSNEAQVSIYSRNTTWAASERLAKQAAGKDASEDARREALKLEKIGQLRMLVKEYQEAILRQKACIAIQAPDKHALREMKQWLDLQGGCLVTPGDRALLEDQEDLTCLSSISETDSLTRFIRARVGFLIGLAQKNRSKYPPSWGPVYKFHEEGVEKFVSFISILMAVSLLIASIVILFFVTRSTTKLGLLCAFIVVFAVAIGLFSNCKRWELFASTATYAAVLVVFVSGNFAKNS